MSSDNSGVSIVDEHGNQKDLYIPTPAQRRFHAATAPNVLMLGSRGGGKSYALRWDCIIRCLTWPNFHALMVRRTLPELRRSHLVFIGAEMTQIGGVFLSTTNIAKFSNGSTITFASCENESDMLNFLSAQYDEVSLDELTTYPLSMFLLISASARSPSNAPYTAIVRAGSNPLGIGSGWVYDFFVDKTVKLEDFPDYRPDDFEVHVSRLEDNPHLDRVAYAARLSNLPEHVRRAWLLGERVLEGQYFSDFRARRDGAPWHVIDDLPTMVDPRTKTEQPILNFPWLSIYRAIDWGYFPDPAVCLWIAVLPSKHAIVFKERAWTRTLAPQVAADITRESVGMKVSDTFCDPSMFLKHGETEFSIGEILEQHHVPLTPSISDRALLGYAIHQYLNTVIDDRPQVQIVKPNGSLGCKELIRTVPQIRMGSPDASKMAAGDDHHVICLAYFCAGSAPPSHDPVVSEVPRWMRPMRQRPRPYA